MAEGFPLSLSAPRPHLKKTMGNVLVVLTMLSSLVCGKVALKDAHLTLLNTPFTHEGFLHPAWPNGPFHLSSASAQDQGFNIYYYSLNLNFYDLVSK